MSTAHCVAALHIYAPYTIPFPPGILAPSPHRTSWLSRLAPRRELPALRSSPASSLPSSYKTISPSTTLFAVSVMDRDDNSTIELAPGGHLHVHLQCFYECAAEELGERNSRCRVCGAKEGRRRRKEDGNGFWQRSEENFRTSGDDAFATAALVQLVAREGAEAGEKGNLAEFAAHDARDERMVDPTEGKKGNFFCEVSGAQQIPDGLSVIHPGYPKISCGNMPIRSTSPSNSPRMA